MSVVRYHRLSNNRIKNLLRIFQKRSSDPKEGGETAGTVQHVVNVELRAGVRAPPALPLQREEVAPIAHGLGGAAAPARMKAVGSLIDPGPGKGLPEVDQGSLE